MFSTKWWPKKVKQEARWHRVDAFGQAVGRPGAPGSIAWPGHSCWWRHWRPAACSKRRPGRPQNWTKRSQQFLTHVKHTTLSHGIENPKKRISKCHGTCFSKSTAACQCLAFRIEVLKSSLTSCEAKGGVILCVGPSLPVPALVSRFEPAAMASTSHGLKLGKNGQSQAKKDEETATVKKTYETMPEQSSSIKQSILAGKTILPIVSKTTSMSQCLGFGHISHIHFLQERIPVSFGLANNPSGPIFLRPSQEARDLHQQPFSREVGQFILQPHCCRQPVKNPVVPTEIPNLSSGRLFKDKGLSMVLTSIWSIWFCYVLLATKRSCPRKEQSNKRPTLWKTCVSPAIFELLNLGFPGHLLLTCSNFSQAMKSHAWSLRRHRNKRRTSSDAVSQSFAPKNWTGLLFNHFQSFSIKNQIWKQSISWILAFQFSSIFKQFGNQKPTLRQSTMAQSSMQSLEHGNTPWREAQKYNTWKTTDVEVSTIESLLLLCWHF